MIVHFKDVNQGDSIIIEWNDSGKQKIGLIDCHSDKNNPSLKYIIDNSIEEIEFVFISHPHFDHFSGIVDLFKYCKQKLIPIKELGFTFDNAVTIAYSNFASYKSKGLLDFFEFIIAESRKNIENKTIKHSFTLHSDTQSKIFSEFKIDFLRPIQDHILSLGKSFGRLLGNEIINGPDLNKYSSVLEVKKDEKSILLTSDAPENTFKSLEKYYSYKKNNFHLVQIPHHGSKNNHYLEFWKGLKRIDNCPSVFSVGEEVKDKLPDFQVVDEIFKEGYSIFSTNNVYGITEHLGNNLKAKKPAIMRTAAKVRSKSSKNILLSKYEGDKIFNF